jgi:hypothetical protein
MKYFAALAVSALAACSSGVSGGGSQTFDGDEPKLSGDKAPISGDPVPGTGEPPPIAGEPEPSSAVDCSRTYDCVTQVAGKASDEASVANICNLFYPDGTVQNDGQVLGRYTVGAGGVLSFSGQSENTPFTIVCTPL